MSLVLPEVKVSGLIPPTIVNSSLEKAPRVLPRLKPVKQTAAPQPKNLELNLELIGFEMTPESILALRRKRVITREAARDLFEAFKRRRQETRINCF